MHWILLNYKSFHHNSHYLVLKIDLSNTVEQINRKLLSIIKLPSRLVYHDGQVLDEKLTIRQILNDNYIVCYELVIQPPHRTLPIKLSLKIMSKLDLRQSNLSDKNLSVNNHPVNNISVNNHPANNLPVNNLPVNNFPVNNLANNNLPVNNLPVNNLPVNNLPVNNLPVNNLPNKNIPVYNLANNIFQYYLRLDNQRQLNFKIAAKYRNELMQNIVNVFSYWGITNTAIQMAMVLFDRCLVTDQFRSYKLWSIALTCGWISSKYWADDDDSVISLEHLVVQNDYDATINDFKDIEIKILKTLDYNLTMVTPEEFSSNILILISSIKGLSCIDGRLYNAIRYLCFMLLSEPVNYSCQTIAISSIRLILNISNRKGHWSQLILVEKDNPLIKSMNIEEIENCLQYLERLLKYESQQEVKTILTNVFAQSKRYCVSSAVLNYYASSK